MMEYTPEQLLHNPFLNKGLLSRMQKEISMV